MPGGPAEPRFAHLSVRSTFSLRDATIAPERLPAAAAEAGMRHVALTDRDGLSGAVRFVRAAEGAGVMPIVGVELALTAQRASVEPRVTLIARDSDGFAALCRAVSHAHAHGRGTPRLDDAGLDALADAGHVIALLGVESPVGLLLARGASDAAATELDRWRDRFGGEDTVLGVRDHRVAPGGRWVHGRPDPSEPGDDARIARTLALAQRSGVRAVAVNDVRHERPDDVVVADVLRCMRLGVPLADRHLGRTTSAAWFTDPATMARRFRERPELLEGAADLAERCTAPMTLGEVRAPRLTGRSPEQSAAALVARSRAGLVRRLGDPGETALARLDRELAAIDEAGLHDLFLAVADVVVDVQAAGILVACRGSAAGSLVCFALGISDVDPVANGLAFERFMNPYRDELPDIDLDVESHRREEVYDLVIARYGEHRVATVGMFETLQARSAVRGVGKALGLPPEEVDHVARRLPRLRGRDVTRAIERLPELAGSRLDTGRLGILLDLVARVDGMPRHLAMHPCGILLGDDALLGRMPVQRSAHGYPVSQFDKDDVAALGLLKLDVLGVRMLSAMRHCLDLVNGVDRDGEPVSESGERVLRQPIRTAEQAHVPGWETGPFTLDMVAHDDPATYELIRSTHSVGMFQIESPGQRELLGRLQPTRFSDLVAEISLFRPGPMRADMITPYVARRHGEEEVHYAHASLEPILAETFGVIVYHEQVMGVLSALTGCDASEADLLRRRLGDADSRRLVRRLVLERARERGLDAAMVEAVFEDVASFASFGFCKAHAAAFAVPTERSAFLKAHLFPEFMAGLITHDPGMYPRRLLVEECRLMGVPVLGPDVVHSTRDATVEVVDQEVADTMLGLGAARAARAAGEHPGPSLPTGWSWEPGAPEPLPPTGCDAGARDDGGRWAVRLGLAGVADLGHDDIGRILALRPFTRVTELRDRVRIGRDAALALVGSGALDTLARVGQADGPRDRRALRLVVEEAWSLRGRRSRGSGSRGSGSRGPRGSGDEGPLQATLSLELSEPPPDLPPESAASRVRGELLTTGIDISAHVVGFYAPLLQELGVIEASRFRELPAGERVRVAGMRVALQSPPQRSGDRVLFLTLDDRAGQVQVTFFSSALADCAWTVREAELVLAEGVVSRRGRRGATLIGRRAWDLTRLWRAWQDGALDRALRERGTPAPHRVAAEVASTQDRDRAAAGRGRGGGRGW
jgi:error-prone DNA polymerase